MDMVLTPMGLRFMGGTYPCTIGRSGVTSDKREGDGATPAGAHRIVGCLYRPDRMARPCDWALPIRPGDLWSDDPGHEDYNLMVRAPYPHSAERLSRADPLYDLILLTDWNWPRADRGRGSAIFIHRWRSAGRPTEGCIALAPQHLRHIVRRIGYETRLIVR
jgi:L,D-peptidoglycan transpeptidase YkuD (ErfK/YbiS/YcfS/YnhG family)